MIIDGGYEHKEDNKTMENQMLTIRKDREARSSNYASRELTESVPFLS